MAIFDQIVHSHRHSFWFYSQLAVAILLGWTAVFAIARGRAGLLPLALLATLAWHAKLILWDFESVIGGGLSIVLTDYISWIDLGVPAAALLILAYDSERGIKIWRVLRSRPNAD